MQTKEIDIIKIDDVLLKELVKLKQRELADAQVNQIEECIRVLIGEIIQQSKKNNWIKFKNKQVYFNFEVSGIFPDFKKFKKTYSTISKYRNAGFNHRFEGFKGQLISLIEFKTVFQKQLEDLYNQYNWELGWNFIVDNQGEEIYDGDGCKTSSYFEGDCIPIYRLYGRNANKKPIAETMIKWMELGLIPQGLTEKSEQFYVFCLNMLSINKNLFQINNGIISIDPELMKYYLLKSDIKTIDGRTIGEKDVQLQLRGQGSVDLPELFSEIFKNRLLSCDKLRGDLEEYDERMLTDPNRGHWDLWDTKINKGQITGKLNNKLMARNPLSDIKHDGIIGIDFGTKSTVVVYQEATEHILPMRVGTGQLSKEVKEHHYENPTVMEFIDIESFMKRYKEKQGRPETLWEDLTTSHTAFSGLLNSKSEEYYAYLNELKQWAGDKKRQLRLRDKKGKDILLAPFLELGEDEFNPIELYAYFIGIYINNMHNGLYLDYILSFPVTYEKAVRDKILDCFSRGIKKSLPEVILNDAKTMENFRVVAGASEPAAYAICALQEYGFEPEEDEKVFYGVFDFGGGTTDFDFGLWREANGTERRYDYVVECFGSGGDQYLGGENLLELLAFEVFKANQNILRTEGITFVLPPECNKFPGSEVLLSQSQEARLNTKQLMEKLRPLWERHNEYEKLYQKGIIKVSLFNNKGEAKPNFELKVNLNELETILVERIDKGIRNFFDSLRLAFKMPVTKDIEFINIFLAGNSSNSPIVRALFEKYTDYFTKEIYGEDTDVTFFGIYPPLGSQEALKIQKEKGLEVKEGDITRPTGKTGVAFGLIESRPGSKIKVIQKDQVATGDEIKFQYYIGYDKKKSFRYITDRDVIYGEWHEFIDATEEDFTLYYTTLPEASSNKLGIQEVNRKKCRISKAYPDANIYYRAIKPTVIEYVVARPDELHNEIYLEDKVTVDLS